MRWNAFRWKNWAISLWTTASLFTVTQLSYGASPSSIAQVYECRVNGQRVFSDQPCAADAAQRDITVQNSVNARDAVIDYRPTSSTQAKRKSTSVVAEAKEKRQMRCEALQDEKSSLTSRLRAGYNVKQGERLRDRLRKVDSQYYDLRCSTRR